MSKRVRSEKSLIRCNNFEQADYLIDEIGQLQDLIAVVERTAKRRTDKAKTILAERTKPLNEKIDLCTRSIEAFAIANKDKFGKKRSRKLQFGTFGWRKSTSIKTKKTTLQLIKDLFSAAKAKTLIIVKESVDRNALAKLADEDLAMVGAKRVVKDPFFVEPDLTKAVNHGV